jgi:predicted ATPase/DNA-binding CsgD family transcriptional regulator
MALDRPTKPETFSPDLASPRAALSTLNKNLPALATPLIGRAKELAFLQDQVVGDDSRLLTVLGPPGVGKTRLALEVAHTTLDRFADGTLFVDLTPIRDPALIIYALAHTLGVREGWEGGAALDLPLERVKDTLRHRQLLLMIDNFEHVVEGAPIVGELLGACPQLKILATSREPLHLQWEQQFPLGPLPIPELDPLPSVDVLSRNPAIAMFVTRARAIVPDFRLSEYNARSVAEICVRLDGLALAIELVVGRVGGVPLSTIVAQLSRRLDFLTGGPRDLPTRQRTLRSAIAWSYELLPSVEQALFRRLAVFAGGAAAEAIQTVCGEAGDPMVDLHTLGALVDKNLLLWTPLPDGSARYRMLESLREFAWEQLEASGEIEVIRARHARFFLELTETAEPELAGPNEAVWQARLEREHDNLRLALEWALDSDLEGAFRFVGGLRRFWNIRGHWSEGSTLAERVLKREAGSVPPAVRAKALLAGAVMALLQGDEKTATMRTEECLALRKALGDQAATAEALWYLGNLARYRHDMPRAFSLYEESLGIARVAGDKTKIATALVGLGRAFREDGDLLRARAMLREALPLARETGEFRSTIAALLGLGEIALDERNLTEAAAEFTEVLTVARKHGDKYNTAEGLEHLAYTSDQQKEFQKAESLLGDALVIYRELGDDGSAAAILRRMGQIVARTGDSRRAAMLIEQSLILNRSLGHLSGIAKSLSAAGVLAFQRDQPGAAALLLAAVSQSSPIGGPRAPEQQVFDQAHVQVQENLRSQHAEAWAAGEAMSFEDAIEEALEVLRNLSGRPVPPDRKRPRSPLSHREEDVAALVAQGLSNREIGKRLFISERTVASHIEHMLNKLAFKSRAQVAAWAASRGLHTPEQ